MPKHYKKFNQMKGSAKVKEVVSVGPKTGKPVDISDPIAGKIKSVWSKALGARSAFSRFASRL